MDMDQALPESCLMIGDKVFNNAGHYPYHYDLAAAWKELTGKPMVFAVWIAAPGIPEEVMQEIDQAFMAGMSFIKSGQSGLSDWQIAYLLHNISYPLDEAKREAMYLFLEWAKVISAEPVNRYT
jgi:chorismate dehydratase